MKAIHLHLILLLLLLSSCGLADLRSGQLKEQGITAGAEQRGRQLLNEAWKAQGMDQLREHETYEVVGKDHWKGLMGRSGNPWPVNNKPLQLRYAVNTFDGQFTVLEGKKEGFTAGLQSWQYYEQTQGQEAAFKVKPEKEYVFVIPTYQYFFELIDRLRTVPVVAYMGEKQFKGDDYDLVFASWKTAKPHAEHDQYVLYINKESRLIDYASYTIRDNFLPAPKSLYGTIQYKDWREVEGIKIPFRQLVYFNGPNKKEKKYLHRFTAESFEFDSFDKKALYPNEELDSIGDKKRNTLTP